VGADAIERRLRDALGPFVVAGEERWGPTLVTRLLVQFRFELRVIQGRKKLVLIHRACASPAQRGADRRIVEASLRSALEGA
jgi:hypothetical protein